jgi:hypothetical protein
MQLLHKIPVRRWRHHLKWALIHAALVLFTADLIAVIWPEFEQVWAGRIAHAGVALAAFLASMSEYIHDEGEENSK